MHRSTDTPIAARTRSQAPMAQQPSSEIDSLTQHQQINENFTELNINDDEGNNMIQEDTKMVASPSTSKLEKKEMSGEQSNNILHSNFQIQVWQENLMAELAQKQKIIEEQQHLLLQLQANIQELMSDKHHSQQSEQHQRLPPQAFTSISDGHSILGIIPSQQTKSPSTDNQIQNNIFKFDNFIEQQLLKDKVNNIRKFSGNKYDDVDEWLENIDHDFPSTLISEESN